MKVIKTNIITDVTADSSDSNYPASNLLDEHPQRKWQANNSTVSSATLTISVNGKASGLGMYGITADSASVSITDPNAVQWGSSVAWATGTEWNQTTADMNVDVTWVTGTDNNSLWVDFSQFDAVVNISVTLYTEANSADVLAAGVAVVGEVQTFNDADYGLSMNPRSYSIKRQLSNGSFYGKKLNTVRTFTGSFWAARNTAFWDFMNMASANDVTPMAWQIADGIGNYGAVYARFEEQPQGAYTHPQYNKIGFTLIEVL